MRVSGGDINDAWLVELGGERLFVKTRAGAGEAEYRQEAAGLRWLGEGGTVRVPDVVAVGESAAGAFLALRWIEPGRLAPDGAEELGRGLAVMHALGAPAHAWLPGVDGPSDQALGSLRIPAIPGPSWPEVYAEQRLRPLARIAFERGAIGERCVRVVAAVCARVPALAGPPEAPARLHGDLWGGNVHADRDGQAWLIDPSAQGGHREMDLAMLRLFGNPGGERLHAAYREAAPLAEGAEDRVELWQLQPLLVHAALFGGHYGAAAERAARRYA